MKRVFCLYRVSTVGQVDHDDIPMQRIACHEYASQKGWTIIKEVYERGVSGYKISSEKRDAIQDLKDAALKGQFDALLVFMFDRLGRREDETPFVVEWFVRHGIEVWSVKEGEQRFEHHVDKLLNYIRYWQASGESEKTSVRVKTRKMQMMQDGFYSGGYVPYGYEAKEIGRLNKRSKPVKDLVIVPDEAAVVRELFDLVVNQGYGTARLALLLNKRGQLTRHGKEWRDTSIRAIMGNPIYIGRMHAGKRLSDQVFEQYRIISDEQFYRAQEIFRQRYHTNGIQRDVPLRTDGSSLLSGLIFCAQCGKRMTATCVVSKRTRVNIYRCDSRKYIPNLKHKQVVYTADRVDVLFLAYLNDFFCSVLSIDPSTLMTLIRKSAAADIAEQLKAAAENLTAKRNRLSDVENTLILASANSNEVAIEEQSGKLTDLRAQVLEAEAIYQAALERSNRESDAFDLRLQELQIIRSAAVNFSLYSMPEKRMFLARVIRKIMIGEGYQIEIEWKGLAKSMMEKTATD